MTEFQFAQPHVLTHSKAQLIGDLEVPEQPQFLKKIKAHNADMDTVSQTSTARSSLGSVQIATDYDEDQQEMSPTFIKKISFQKTKSSSFKVVAKPIKGLFAEPKTGSIVSTFAPQVAKVTSIVVRIAAKKAKNVVVEPESDNEFDRECSEDTPSAFICQNNVYEKSQIDSLTVKLGKRSHRESYLPQGPAFAYLKDKKRFKKAEKVPQKLLLDPAESDSESSSLDDFLDQLENEVESSDENPMGPQGHVRAAMHPKWNSQPLLRTFPSPPRFVPALVRTNATIMMSFHDDCLYM